MNKKIVMIGDSITHAFDTKKLLSEFDIINKGVPGNNSKHVLKRLKRDVTSLNPDIVFVLIGTNDFAQGYKDDEILNNITQISDQLINILPDTEIFLTAVLPTKNDKTRPNTRINKLNKEMKNLASNKKINFFDLHKYFADENGELIDKFTDDGLHLTEIAYKKWAEILKKEINRFIKLLFQKIIKE